MEKASSIYICLEGTADGEQRGTLAQQWLQEALKRQYPEAKTVVETEAFSSYDDTEKTNIPMALLARTVSDARKRKVELCARIVPLMMAWPVTWRVHTQHGMLLIASAKSDGTGDCICTPTANWSEPVDSLGKVWKRLVVSQNEIGGLFKRSSEAEDLTRFIVNVLQKESISAGTH